MAILSLACCGARFWRRAARNTRIAFALAVGLGWLDTQASRRAYYAYVEAEEIGLERSYDDFGITFVSVPTWAFLSFTWFFPLLWAMPLGFEIVRRFKPQRRGRLCHHCFYECSAHYPGNKCPECGTIIPNPSSEPPNERSQKNPRPSVPSSAAPSSSTPSFATPILALRIL